MLDAMWNRRVALWLIVLPASLFKLFHRVDPDPDGDLLQLSVVAIFVTAMFVAAYRPEWPRPLRTKPTRGRPLEYDTLTR